MGEPELGQLTNMTGTAPAMPGRSSSPEPNRSHITVPVLETEDERELEDEREVELEVLLGIRQAADYWDLLGSYLESLDPEEIRYQLFQLEEGMDRSLALAQQVVLGEAPLGEEETAELSARLTRYYPSEIKRLRKALRRSLTHDRASIAQRTIDRLCVGLLEEGPSTDLLRFLIGLMQEEGSPQLQELFRQLDRLEADGMANADEITSRSWIHEELERRWPFSLGSLGADARGWEMEAILGSATEARERLVELVEEEIYMARKRLGRGEKASQEEHGLNDENHFAATTSAKHPEMMSGLVRGVTESVRAAHPGLLPLLPKGGVLVGMDVALEGLERYVESALFFRDEVSRLFPGSIPRGLILHGPTGVGKTESVRLIAQRLRKKGRRIGLYLVPTSSFLSSGLGESDKNIERLFQEDLPSILGREEGVIVLFDELDGIARTRSSTSSPLDRILNLLFILIDQVDPLERLLIIGTTNRYELLDPAIVRRLGLATIQIPQPGQDARAMIWRHYLSGLGSNGLLTGIDYQDLAASSEGLSGGEIENIVCGIILQNIDKLGSKERLTQAEIRDALKLSQATPTPSGS